jgi:hypothetical protein
MAEQIIGVLDWRQDHWQACFEVMQERPRRRKLQALPPSINLLLEVCRKAGLCAMYRVLIPFRYQMSKIIQRNPVSD